MRTSIRALFLLPVLILALVAIPSVVFSAAGQPQDALAGNTLGDVGQTVPGGTVPPPTPRPRPPVPTPTPTPGAVSKSAAFIERERIEKVIGDRLSSTIYAFTEDGYLYRSNRDGYGWLLVTTEPQMTDFIMNAADPNVLYSGSGADCSNPAAQLAPMYKSTDGGYTWEQLPAAMNLKPLLTDQGNPNHLFAADCTTLYLSTDGGVTWSPKPAEGDNLWAAYAPAGMASGSLVGEPRPAQPHWEQIFAIGNSADGVGAVAFSGNLGDSWANITRTDAPPMQATVVVAHLFDGGKLWVVDEKGVWATVDYGVNWIHMTEGLKALTRTNRTALNALTYGYNGKLFLATDIGLYEWELGGSSWVKSTDTGFATQHLTGLLVTESSPRVLWVNSEDGVFTYTVKD